MGNHLTVTAEDHLCLRLDFLQEQQQIPLITSLPLLLLR